MKLAHRVEGEGPPLILLNGIAMTMAAWGPIAADLTVDFTVIRCDLRGQLLTPGPAPADIADHADDVLELLDDLGIASVHIVSTSFGGAVGAIIAGRAPARARSLISVASADGFTDAMEVEIDRWRSACRDVLDGAPGRRVSEVLEPVVYSAEYLAGHVREREASKTATDALPARWFSDLISLLDSAGGAAFTDALGKVKCPTLIAAAELDGFVPRERCRALADAIDGARFEVLPGAGHAVVAEDPALVAGLVRDFIKGLGQTD